MEQSYIFRQPFFSEIQIHPDKQSPSISKYWTGSPGKQIHLALSRILTVTGEEKFLRITPGPRLERTSLYSCCNKSLR